MIEADFGRVIMKHKTSTGAVYIFDLIPSMRAVIVLDDDDQIILSRNFPYTAETSKSSFTVCRAFYKKVKELLFKKDLDGLEELL